MTPTQMLREIQEIPDVVERQVTHGARLYRGEGERLRREPPRFFVSCARGSSDQAVTYFKYLVESRFGIPVASVGPSVASIYHADLRLRDVVLLTVSQSGASPDLVRLQQKAMAGGARSVALLNVTNSPVGQCAHTVLPMLAGPETAVAATKSFVASLVALASVVAHWSEDRALLEALEKLPEDLAEALQCDWSTCAVPFAVAHSLFTIARGPSLGIAGEAALKFKETCRLHAEAQSAAEVHHGPMALARERFAALVFANGDESDGSTCHAAEVLAGAGADVFMAGTSANGTRALPVIKTQHPVLNPISLIVSCYLLVEKLSTALGENPDAPALLKKVTETI